MNQRTLPLSSIQHGGGVFTEGLCCEGRVLRLVEWFRSSWISGWIISDRCSQRGTWQLRISERYHGCGFREGSDRYRCGEGPRFEGGLGEGLDSCGCRRGTSDRVWTLGKAWGFLLGPLMVQLVCRVCYSLEMFLMRWDTCRDFNEGQNLLTTRFFFLKFYLLVLLPASASASAFVLWGFDF